MSTSYLTFETTHHALWAEEVAIEAGIAVELVPAPARAHARCNLALVSLPGDFDRLTGALKDAGVDFGIYRERSLDGARRPEN